MVLNYNVPIAVYRRRERDEVANHTIMLHVRIDIRVKLSANTNIGRQCYKWRKNGAFADNYLI